MLRVWFDPLPVGRDEKIKTCVIIRDDAVRTMHVFVLSEPAWWTFMLALLSDQTLCEKVKRMLLPRFVTTAPIECMTFAIIRMLRDETVSQNMRYHPE